MRYVALLRGINVGGNNPIAMTDLQATFTRVGCTNVQTYINTGNIIFDSIRAEDEVVLMLEQAILKDSGLPIKVLVRTKERYLAMMADIPDSWTNDAAMKSDVLFLWDDVDNPKIIDTVTPRKGIDTGRYSNGALLWSVSRKHQSKSVLTKIAGSALYKKMTIRNVNTARKIALLL